MVPYFADFRISWELQHFGGADFRTADSRTAGNRRKLLQKPVCAIEFVPSNSALISGLLGSREEEKTRRSNKSRKRRTGSRAFADYHGWVQGKLWPPLAAPAGLGLRTFSLKLRRAKSRDTYPKSTGFGPHRRAAIRIARLAFIGVVEWPARVGCVR